MQEKPVTAIEDGGRSTLDLRADADRTLLPPFEAPASFHTSVDESRLLAIDWTQAPGWAIAYSVRYEHLEARFAFLWVGSSTDGELAQTLPAPQFFPVDITERGKLIFFSYDRSIATRVAVRQAACAVVATETAKRPDDQELAAADDQRASTPVDHGALAGGQVEEATGLIAGQQPRDLDQAAVLELRKMGYSLAEATTMIEQIQADEKLYPMTKGEAGEGLPEAQAVEEQAGYFYRNHETPQMAIDKALKLGEQRHMRVMGLGRAAMAHAAHRSDALAQLALEHTQDVKGYRAGVEDGRAEILRMVPDPERMTMMERTLLASRVMAGKPLTEALAFARIEDSTDAG